MTRVRGLMDGGVSCANRNRGRTSRGWSFRSCRPPTTSRAGSRATTTTQRTWFRRHFCGLSGSFLRSVAATRGPGCSRSSATRAGPGCARTARKRSRRPSRTSTSRWTSPPPSRRTSCGAPTAPRLQAGARRAARGISRSHRAPRARGALVPGDRRGRRNSGGNRDVAPRAGAAASPGGARPADGRRGGNMSCNFPREHVARLARRGALGRGDAGSGAPRPRVRLVRGGVPSVRSPCGRRSAGEASSPFLPASLEARVSARLAAERRPSWRRGVPQWAAIAAALVLGAALTAAPDAVSRVALDARPRRDRSSLPTCARS